MNNARCLGVGPDIFYFEQDGPGNDPETAPLALAAKAICVECPVVVECATQALLDNEEWGVWGTTTRSQRKRLRSKLSRMGKVAIEHRGRPRTMEETVADARSIVVHEIERARGEVASQLVSIG